MDKAKIKYECPVCHSLLHHIRTDNGTDGHVINKDGTIVDCGGKCNGDDQVFCSKDKEHDIPQELMDAVLDLIY